MGTYILWINRNDHAEHVDATFRVEGKVPELWDPATGKTTAVAYKIADGRTTIPLHLDPYGSTFVVFPNRQPQTSLEVPEPEETQVSCA